MKTPLFIFLKGLGLYSVFTIPLITVLPMYVISLYFALVYGWFAFAVFTAAWIIVKRLSLSHPLRMLLLFAAVPAAVAFAFQMIEVCGGWKNVWYSGGYLFFPLSAVLAGWVGVAISATAIQKACEDIDQSGKKPLTYLP